MNIPMQHLQISLPSWQVQFLSQRAQRDGLEIAEVIKQIVQREIEALRAQRDSADSVWDMVGIVYDEKPLIHNIAVSEKPELYLAESIFPKRRQTRKRKTARR